MLIVRFLLNLRQLNAAEQSPPNSDAQHFSRFSAPNFRVPSDFLGNIGEPLDYGQVERYIQGDNVDGDMGEHSNSRDGDHVAEVTVGDRAVAGPSGTRWDIEESMPAAAATSCTVFIASFTSIY